jgi:hypothetical protein
VGMMVMGGFVWFVSRSWVAMDGGNVVCLFAITID